MSHRLYWFLVLFCCIFFSHGSERKYKREQDSVHILSDPIPVDLQRMYSYQLKAKSKPPNCKSKSPWSKYLAPAKITATPHFHLKRPWYGRLGNNLVEIKNALRYAVCCQGTLQIDSFEIKFGSEYDFDRISRYYDFRPKFSEDEERHDSDQSGGSPFINSKTPPDQVGLDVNLTDPRTQDRIMSYEPPRNCQGGWALPTEKLFHTRTHMKHFPLPDCVFDEYSLLQAALFGNFLPRGCPTVDDTCGSKFDNTLVIHVRSGDIFKYFPSSDTTTDESYLHSIKKYTQPPLMYYKSIINLQSPTGKPWSSVLFVTSSEKNHSHLNPVWKFFKKRAEEVDSDGKKGRYNKIPIRFQQSTDLMTDVKTLLCARYFVKASSMMSEMIVRTSPNLLVYYTPSDNIGSQCHGVMHGLTCVLYNLTGYYEAIGWNNWLNLGSQKNQMITYPFPLQNFTFSKQ